ncbi:MAG UNVERIFIED_CONTAM: hypothetical protein LVT10_16575 [Anaerolineae bacterium]
MSLDLDTLTLYLATLEGVQPPHPTPLLKRWRVAKASSMSRVVWLAIPHPYTPINRRSMWAQGARWIPLHWLGWR